MKFVLNVMLRD